MKFIYLLCALLAGCTNQIQPKVEFLDKYKIEVVAPGSSASTEFLKSLPVKFNGCYQDDQSRAEVLKKALLNEENQVLWALRGGYGTGNVVEILYNDKEFIKKLRQMKKHPLLIGYSDITALHLFLTQEIGWKTVHGPVFREIQDSKKWQNFRGILSILDGVKQIKFFGLSPLNDLARKSKNIFGKLTGGNLSIIQTSIGTRWEIDTKNKILFLEDCNEPPYKIDRTLNHLRAAKILDNTKGVVIGNLCDRTSYINNTIKNFSEKVQIPIYLLDVFGHGVYNYPMIYNSDVEISSEDGVMILKNFVRE